MDHSLILIESLVENRIGDDIRFIVLEYIVLNIDLTSINQI